jgi:1-acyl-sn-glycerol-3-phosphate acyltransferase
MGQTRARAAGSYSPAARKATELLMAPLISALARHDWAGQENIPRSGGVILAANHLSYADTLAVALFSYRAGRYPVFLVKSSLFEIRVLGPFLRSVGQLPVRRGQADAALVLRDAERAVTAGECVIFYPEGTATRDPELWPMVAKTGVARLALTTGVPVIPLAHWGAQAILRYGTARPHLLPRKPVRIVAGPPCDLSAFHDKPLTAETLRAATDVIMGDITKLLAGIRGEDPPSQPYDPVARRRGRAGEESGVTQPPARSRTAESGSP